MVLGPQFAGRAATPDFGHAFSNHSYFRACGRFSLRSVQRARRLGGEKRRGTRKGGNYNDVLLLGMVGVSFQTEFSIELLRRPHNAVTLTGPSVCV